MAAIGGCLGDDDDDDENGAANGDENGEENGDENGEENGDENGEEENGEEENGEEDTATEMEFTGTGSMTTDPFDVENGFFALRVDPYEDLAIDVVDEEGGTWRSMDWDLRNYQGFPVISVPAGEYELDVEADEDVEWTITAINDPADGATAVELPVTVEGSEPTYAGPMDFSEGVTASVDYEGEGEFFLKLYALDGDQIEEVLFEEGAFEDEVEVDYDEWGWMLITGSEEYEITFDASEE